MSEALRAVVLNYEYPPVGAGAGRVAQRLVRELAGLGVRQTVITSWFPGLPMSERPEPGVTVVRVPTWRFSRREAGLAAMATYVLAAGAVLAWQLLRRPSLVHAHFLVPVAPLAWLAWLVSGTPYVVTLHGGDVPGNDSRVDGLFRLLGPLPRWVMRRARALVCVSRDILPLVERAAGVPVEHVPNGVDVLDEADVGPGGPGGADGPLELLFAGRLVELKNVHLLIQALDHLPRELPRRLTICGEGPLREELERVAGDKVARGEVVFAGWLDPEAMARAYARSHVFLLPSRSEGFSLAAMEAMGSGCALVLSDIPGNREIVRPGVNGELCSRDPEDIARAVAACAARLDELRAGALATASEYAWPRQAERYLEIYRRAAGRAS